MPRSSVPAGSSCVSSDSRSLLLEAGIAPGLMTKAGCCVRESRSAQCPAQRCCCWLWPLAGCAPTQPQFTQPKMGMGTEPGWVTSVLICDTNPDSANGTRLCMTVLVASLTLKSISLFKVLNESRVDLERQTLLIIFSYIPVTV